MLKHGGQNVWCMHGNKQHLRWPIWLQYVMMQLAQLHEAMGYDFRLAASC